MPGHPSSSVFFGATPVFGRAEFAKAVDRHPGDRAVTELLKYHLRAGNIRRIARGVFTAIPSIDRFLAASRLRTGAVIAYQSALELHGYAASPANEVQLIVRGEPGLFATTDFTCRFVSPPSQLSAREGVIAVDRQGLTINVTTRERTLADLFDRYDLAGGADELFQSLDLVVEREDPLDIDALIGFARRRNNAAAAGALGFWLDRERHRLAVTDAALEELRPLAPRHARYALGATPGHGRTATGWNVILPSGIVEKYFDD